MRTSYRSQPALLLVSACAGLLALASTPAQAQLIDLQAIGIDASFEIPDLGGNDSGEQVNDIGFGPGWSFNALAGNLNDWGVQDPGVDFFDRVADTGNFDDLAAPFEGRQIGFVNLNDAGVSSGELVSSSVGTLQGGTTLTLRVGVGIRQNQAAWNVDYDIGLRTLGGTDLGTFANINKDNTTLPEDLVYTLNVGAADPMIGEEVAIVIRSTNTGAGFSQSAFDNVRLEGALGDPNFAMLTIDRQTGIIMLSKTGPDDFPIRGYSLGSDAGAFDQSGWTTISDAYDDSGDGSVDDNDNWSVLSAAGDPTDLSEFNFDTAPGDPGTLSSPSPIDLGAAWLSTPYEDVTAEIKLASGATVSVPVSYSGLEIPEGDLDGDGDITSSDWTLFKAGQGTDFTGMSLAEAYLHADLDGDFDHDLADFVRFRTAYDEVNGAGAFVSMAAAPEPGSFVLAMLGGVLGAVAARRRTVRALRVPAAVLLIVLFSAFSVDTASAQINDIVAHWSFDADSIAIDGGAIVSAFDDTSNHDTSIGAGTFLTSDTVAGQYGEALRFNGDNHMTYPNLTELMASAGAPSYTISMWVQWPSNAAAPVGGSPFQTMSNWGDVTPGTAGSTSSHVFAFGPNGATSMRGQTRAATDADGGDIFAQSSDTSLATGQNGSSGTVNDDAWHMYTWTFDSTTGDFNAYFDAFLVESTNEGPDALADSTSPTGNFGWKADSMDHLTGDVRLDEVWVTTGVATQDEVNSLFTENFGDFTKEVLTLRVDPVSGRMQIRNDANGNDTSNPITFSSYRITSEEDSLDASGWSPIAGQNIAGFPSGNGTGNGWESGDNSDSGELVEWRLSGDSTLNFDQAVNLGFGFDETVNSQDLRFQYTLESGAIKTGEVVYGTIVVPSLDGDYNEDGVVDAADYTVWRDNVGQPAGTLPNDSTGVAIGQQQYTLWRSNYGASVSLGASSEAAPEPSTLWLLLGAPLVAALRRWRRVPVYATVGGACVVLTLACTFSVSAAVTVDRDYQFGDDDGVTAGGVVSLTFDSAGMLGNNTFADLAAGGSPTYVNVGSDGLQRPGAAAGSLGIEFHGSDWLQGDRFNYPANATGTIASTVAPGPNDYTGVVDRGFQVWVYPDEANLEDLETDGHEQFVIHDTTEHGARIDDDRSWNLVYDGAIVDSGTNIEAGDQWFHVMSVTLPGASGSVLYVNGVAIKAEPGGYDTTPDGGNDGYLLTVATRTDNVAIPAADSDFFTGVMDDLQIFTFGKTTTGIDLGTFNFATDNAWAAMNLTGVNGDVNQDGVLSNADVTAFIAGWGSENLVDGIAAGDITSVLDGDLDFNGVVDLDDAVILHDSLLTQGAPGLDFSLLGAQAPEPAAITVLALAAVLGMGGCRPGRAS